MKRATLQRTEEPLPATADQKYQSRILRQYFVRFHMSLILAAVIASGVLLSKGLLELGVHSLRLRYPLAVLGSYLVFLLLVRVWMWYVSTRMAASSFFSSSGSGGSFSFDGPGGGSGSGGGGFRGFGGGDSGGGGASGSWDSESSAAMMAEPIPAPATSSGWFPSLDLDIDCDDGFWVLILLAALVAAILGAGGYLIYAAPHILPEAAWQALLATSLHRAAKQTCPDWRMGVLRSTGIPFAAVLVLATALGWEAHHHCPSAVRLVQVFNCPTR